MTPTPSEIAWFLSGTVTGAIGVFALSGLAMWFLDVRAGLREGDATLDGSEFERNRKRGEP